MAELTEPEAAINNLETQGSESTQEKNRNF
jgi:hypothetical protein